MASIRRTSPTRPPLFDRQEIISGLARAGRGLLAVAVVIIVVFLAVVAIVPAVTGGSSFTVDSRSGPSAIPNGSLAFVEPVRLGAIEAGDVLTTSEARSEISTRRVVAVTRDREVIVETPDGAATEPLDEEVIEGRVWLHLRSLGTVRDVLAGPLALVALVGTAAVLVARWVLDRRTHAAARAHRARDVAAASGPVTADAEPDDGSEIRVQVMLALMTDVDDVALRFALAELGGSVMGSPNEQARLVRLVGTKQELDRAEVHLAELGRIDAVRRSDEVSMPLPGSSAPGAAA